MNMPIKRRFVNFPLLLFLLAVIFPCLPACGPQITKPGSATGAEATVKELLDAEDYAGAAREYLRLARLHPKKSLHYQFRAVDSYIRAELGEEASALLEQITVTPKENIPAFEKAVLMARIALLSGQPEQALDYLSLQVPKGTPADLIGDYYNTRAQVYEKQSLPFKAVSERISRQPYLSHSRDQENNLDHLWYDLNSIKVSELEELRSSATGELAGWLDLALINQTLLFKREELKLAIKTWSEHYPSHPAIPDITGEIIKAGEEMEFSPRKIALLLPLTGQFKTASEAIRDGFLATWLYENGYKPEIHIYDADSLNIVQIYQKAVDDGADFIVGPLEKSAVKTLSERETLPVMTLALNRLDAPASGKSYADNFSNPYSTDLIQFGLAPEDEARQIAHQGIINGETKALIISPGNEWGQRLASAFSNEWESLGGMILEQISYDPLTKDFITPVKKLLNIDSSETRINNLRHRLSRNLKAVSRMREDIDAIFMAATPLIARQIVPQFRFFSIGDIPVYTTSNAYTGTDNPQTNSDINGVEFTDMPWILAPETKKTPLQIAVDNDLAAGSSPYRRLYAFGVDAFNLIPHLKQLSLQHSSVYSGATGELYMRHKNIIQRKLEWARIVDGRPELMNFLSTP